MTKVSTDKESAYKGRKMAILRMSEKRPRRRCARKTGVSDMITQAATVANVGGNYYICQTWKDSKLYLELFQIGKLYKF